MLWQALYDKSQVCVYYDHSIDRIANVISFNAFLTINACLDLTLCMCVFPSFSLHIFIFGSICLSVHMCVFMSVYMSLCMSAYLSVTLSLLFLSNARLCGCSVYVCLYVCLCVYFCLSVTHTHTLIKCLKSSKHTAVLADQVL